MAKSAKPSAKAPTPKQKGGMRPMLLALGLGLYWFVEYPDGAAEPDVPMWGYLVVNGARVLADFVGAWCIVSALQLVIALGRIGLTYLRTLWVQEG